MFKCPHCPCVFETEEDLKKHMDTFGCDREEHIRKLRRAHYDIERPEN